MAPAPTGPKYVKYFGRPVQGCPGVDAGAAEEPQETLYKLKFITQNFLTYFLDGILWNFHEIFFDTIRPAKAFGIEHVSLSMYLASSNAIK